MTADLAQWALALPLRVRQELAKVPGPGWLLSSDRQTSLHSEYHVSWAWPDMGSAWLPCDPTAILAHAAGLAGARFTRWGISSDTKEPIAVVAYILDPSGHVAGAASFIDADSGDPHHAAVAVLVKVMDAIGGLS